MKRYTRREDSRCRIGADRLQVLISAYNFLNDGRYFDSISQKSFEVDHASLASTLRQIIIAYVLIVTDGVERAVTHA